LHYAADSGDLKSVTLLLSAHAAINALDSRGYLPLTLACFNGHVNIVKLMIAHGAWVDPPTSRPELTPLNAAITGRNLREKKTTRYSREHGRIIDLLLSAGCDINKTDFLGAAPVWVAATRADVETIRKLIQHDADVNARDKLGGTALMSAVVSDLRSAEDAIRVLLEHGADTTPVNKQGLDAAGMVQRELDEGARGQYRARMLRILKMIQASAAGRSPMPPRAGHDTACRGTHSNGHTANEFISSRA
jgi:ankyrin repeat protein